MELRARLWNPQSSRVELRASRTAKVKDAANAMKRSYGWVRERIAFARTLRLAVLGGTLIVLSCLTAPPSAHAETCPNGAIREAQGQATLNLPDCRAYELVSALNTEPYLQPNPEKNPDQFAFKVTASLHNDRSSPDGDSLAYFSIFAPGAEHGPQFLSTRGPSGWRTAGTVPPQSPQNFTASCYNAYPAGFSTDFSREVFADGHKINLSGGSTAGGCPFDEPPLLPGEPQGAQNLFLRDNEAGTYRLLDPAPLAPLVPGATSDAWFQAASDDLGLVVFSEAAQLIPEAPPIPAEHAKEQTYGFDEDFYAASSGGALRLLTVLPDGSPVRGSLANATVPLYEFAYSGRSVETHPLSADGSRAYFYAGGEYSSGYNFGEADLYLRQNPGQPQSGLEEPHSGEYVCTEPANACTVQVDQAEAGAPGPSGGGTFLWASADGSRAFFADENRLTTNSTAEPGKPDLYEYDLERPAAQRLTDLTPDASEPADVIGVSGASEDGSYLYFVAQGNLTGEAQNSQGAQAQAGQPNLYLSHQGALTFIATLDPAADQLDWNGVSRVPNKNTARVSANGAFIGFNSIDPLTGYDNAGPDCPGGEPCEEIFLYNAAHNRLTCASCDPSASPPTASSYILPPEFGNDLSQTEGNVGYPQRNVSDHGQVFFSTAASLLPADTNDLSDVYEYDVQAPDGHQLHLISPGTADNPAYFLDADPNGNNVFFITDQRLLSADTDNARSVYDARESGGFPEPSLPTSCESEETCHENGTAEPSSSSLGTAHFQGPEEGPAHPEAACKRGFVKKHGRCVKPRKHHHTKHRRHHGRAPHRARLQLGGAR